MADRLAGCRVALALGASTGGIGRHVCSLAAELVEAGVRVRVCGPPDTLARFDMAGTGAELWPARTVTRARTAFRGADLVHAHGLRPGLRAAVAAPPAAPVVVTWHNASLVGGPRGVLHHGLARVSARRADVSLCVSSDLAASIRRLGGRDVRPAVVAAPPLRPSEHDVAAVRAGLGAGDRPLVLAVGRLHPQKGHELLIDAARELGAANPPPLVAIAGDGPQRGQLEGRIARTGAPVRLLGWRDDVAGLLAAADVVVLPSRWEGSPLALQEALRARRPVVATAVGGTPAVARDGALLVPAGDPRALAAAIRRLLDDPAAAAAYAERAGRAAAALPTERDVIEQIRALYVELLGPPPPQDRV